MRRCQSKKRKSRWTLKQERLMRTIRRLQRPIQRSNVRSTYRRWIKKNINKLSACLLSLWLMSMMIAAYYLHLDDEIIIDAVTNPIIEEFVQNVRAAKLKPVKATTEKHRFSQTQNEITDTTHWCHSRDYNDDAWKRSSCLFKDICVVSTPNASAKHEMEWIYISDEEPVDVSFTLGIGPHSVDDRIHFEPVHFTKEEFQSLYPTVRRQSGTSVVFYEYNAENFGHALTDTFLPIYSALEAFGKVSNDVKLFRYSIENSIGWSCDFQKKKRGEKAWKSCLRMYELQTPLVSKYPVTILNASLHSVNVPICFDEVIVGMSQYSDDCNNGHAGREKKVGNWELNCMSGRQNQLWNYRSNGMKNYGVNDIVPIKHQIVVTKRTGGMMSRNLSNLEDLVNNLKQTFGDENVLFVDWSKINMTEQLRIISSTTVHITPPGGVSFISLFLPRWATSIRLYPSEYLLEWNFYNYLGYIKPEHLDCPGGNINISEVESLVMKGIKRYNKMSGRKITFNA